MCSSGICKKSLTASKQLFYPGIVRITSRGSMDSGVRDDIFAKSLWSGTKTGDGILNFGHERQVTLFFTSSSQSSAAPESFMLGIERDYDLNQVTMILKGLGGWGRVAPAEERIQWHIDLHKHVKEQNASVRLKLRGSRRDRLLQKNNKEVEILATATMCRLDGILAGQQKCVIDLRYSPVPAASTTARSVQV